MTLQSKIVELEEARKVVGFRSERINDRSLERINLKNS